MGALLSDIPHQISGEMRLYDYVCLPGPGGMVDSGGGKGKRGIWNKLRGIKTKRG